MTSIKISVIFSVTLNLRERSPAMSDFSLDSVTTKNNDLPMFLSIHALFAEHKSHAIMRHHLSRRFDQIQLGSVSITNKQRVHKKQGTSDGMNPNFLNVMGHM